MNEARLVSCVSYVGLVIEPRALGWERLEVGGLRLKAKDSFGGKEVLHP
jgi:hypothetical protein